MDDPIMLSPHDIWNIVLSICGMIVAISAAVAVLVRLLNRLSEPDKKQDERITALEEAVKKINQRLELGNRRFEADTKQVEQLENDMRSTNNIMLESLQVLIEHDIDGNNVAGLKDMKHKLDKFLLERR